MSNELERKERGPPARWSPEEQTRRLRLLAWLLGVAGFMIGGTVGAILSIMSIILGGWLAAKR